MALRPPQEHAPLPPQAIRHATPPRGLSSPAVREVDSGIRLQYPLPCSGGDFCNGRAPRACTFLYLSPTASRSLFLSPHNRSFP